MRRKDKENDKGKDLDKHENEEEPLGEFLSEPLPEGYVVALNGARSSGENVKRTHKRREEANKKLWEDTQESTRGLDTVSMYKWFDYSQDKKRHKTNQDEIGGDYAPRSCGWCPRCTGSDEKCTVQ